MVVVVVVQVVLSRPLPVLEALLALALPVLVVVRVLALPLAAVQLVVVVPVVAMSTAAVAVMRPPPSPHALPPVLAAPVVVAAVVAAVASSRATRATRVSKRQRSTARTTSRTGTASTSRGACARWGRVGCLRCTPRRRANGGEPRRDAVKRRKVKSLPPITLDVFESTSEEQLEEFFSAE